MKKLLTVSCTAIFSWAPNLYLTKIVTIDLNNNFIEDIKSLFLTISTIDNKVKLAFYAILISYQIVLGKFRWCMFGRPLQFSCRHQIHISYQCTKIREKREIVFSSCTVKNYQRSGFSRFFYINDKRQQIDVWRKVLLLTKCFNFASDFGAVQFLSLKSFVFFLI